ncbi:nucleotidyltransferase family protein [Halanaerobaculum tunisiense]
MLDAIILAGAKNDSQLQQVSNQDYEALIDLNGQAMVKYVIDTLHQVQIIDKVLGVGPSQLKKQGVDIVIPDQGSLLDNIKYSLQSANSPYALLVTADIPLLTTEAIDTFLTRCVADNYSCYYPIIPRSAIEEFLPQFDKTYFKLQEGTFTGGNLVLLQRQLVWDLESEIDKVLQWRKKPWKLVSLLGIRFIFKLWTGTLTIDSIEQRVVDLFGQAGKGIILSYPEVGCDIDQVKQLRQIKERYYTLATT